MTKADATKFTEAVVRATDLADRAERASDWLIGARCQRAARSCRRLGMGA